jgi:hypothetical protein
VRRWRWHAPEIDRGGHFSWPQKYVKFRNLIGVTHTEEQAKALAASYQIKDGPDDSGAWALRRRAARFRAESTGSGCADLVPNRPNVRAPRPPV